MKNEIEQIIAYMRVCVSETLKVEDVAHHFGYNHSYFSREFKKMTGISPAEYLASLKIEHGINSLTKGESIINSQLEAGHQSTGTYATTFKKNTGLSPRDYAKKMNEHFEISKKQEDMSTDSNQLFYRNPSFSIEKSPFKLTVYITVPEKFEGLIFSGLFEKPNPNHLPLMGRCQVKNYQFIFYHLPAGTYYPLACGIPKSLNIFNYFSLNRSMRSCDGQSITFPLEKDETIYLELRDKLPTDPPVIINLPNLLATAITEKIKRNQNKVKEKLIKSK